MNYNTAIFLINDNVRAIKVTYETGDNAPREMFKTFDKSIKVDDYVVVPTTTRHNLTVCKVVEVDIDDWMDTSKPIEWIVGRVDVADANYIKDQETLAIAKIKEAEKLKRKRELKDSLEQAMVDNGLSLKALPIATLNNDLQPISGESADVIAAN